MAIGDPLYLLACTTATDRRAAEPSTHQRMQLRPAPLERDLGWNELT